MRRPLDGPRRVTGDTASHADYRPPVGPATDYGANTGEPVYAPQSGSVTHWWSNTGGWTVAVTDDEWRIVLQHNSGYRGPSSGVVGEGTLIAVAGSTGSATSGPHVHGWAERVNAVGRYSIEDWLRIYGGFKNTANKGGTVPGPYSTSTAGDGDYTPIIEEEEEMTAIRIRDAGNGSIAWATIGTGHFWELPNTDYEALLNGWNLWDRTKDMDVPSNLYGFLKNVAIQNRGSVDAKAVAAAVVATMPQGQIDSAALTFALEAALGDDFAAIPKAVITELKNAL